MTNNQRQQLYQLVANREPVIFNPNLHTAKENAWIREILLMAGYIRVKTAKDGTQQWEAGE